MATRTTAIATRAAQPPASSTGAAYGYNNLPGTLANWTPYKAPTTNDTVYLGQQASGSYIYVGPDNQPYSGPLSAFGFAPGGSVYPTSAAKPVSWSSLGVSGADPNIYESTYTGPGAQSQVSNDTAYAALIVKNPSENLISSNLSLISGAGGVASNLPTAPAAPPLPSGTIGAPTGASGATNPSVTSTTAQSDPNNLSGTPAIGATDPYQTMLDSLLSGVNSNASGASVPGSGSVAGGLPIIGSDPTTTSSTGAPTWVIWALVLAGAGLVYWWYRKHHHAASPGEASEKKD